jgi:hypothetical protein
MSLQDAVITPHEFTLADGESYSFVPISPAIWVDFCKWLNVKHGRKRDLPMGFEDMMDGAQSVEGMMQLCHRSFSKTHKGSYDEFSAMVPSLGLLKDIFEAIIDIGGGEDADDDADPPSLSIG